MRDAPDRVQRAMNHCLAQIGREGGRLAELVRVHVPPSAR